jgi:hypothetical protein
MDVPKLLAIVSILFGWLPVLTFFRKAPTTDKTLRILAAALVIAAFSDGVGFLLGELKVYTIVLYNVQDILQFLLLSRMYYKILFNDEPRLTMGGKVVFIPATACYVISFIVVSMQLQDPFSKFQNIMWTISAGIIIIYCCMYCNKLLIEVSTSKNVKLNVFVWINSGILYYFSFSIFLFLMQSYIVSELTPDIARLTWSFNNINNIIKNVLITIGLVSYSHRPAERQN